jgi:hypothetical protein
MSFVRRASAVFMALAVCGCSGVLGNKDPHDPGAPVGIYHLTATVDTTSTCAEAVAAAPKPWLFDVTLRRDKQVGYWIVNGQPLQGTIDDKGAVTFTASFPSKIHDVDKRRELGACTIIRTDSFTGALAGPPATAAGIASFTGTLRYSYVVEAGSDCRDVVGPVAEGRPSPIFATLPCEVHFAVTATKYADQPK